MPTTASESHPPYSTSSKNTTTKPHSQATTTQTPTPTPSLTLPSSIFAKIAPASHLHHSLSQKPPTRPSTTNPPRLPSSFRRPHLHNPTLPHTVGSSVLRLGSTALTVGITHSILPAASVPDPPSLSASEEERLGALGLLVPNVELSPGCCARFAPLGGGGQAPSSEAQGLSVRLLRLLLSTGVVRLEDLTIRRGSRQPLDAGGDGKMDLDTANDDDAGSEHMDEGNEIAAYHVLQIHILVLSLDGLAPLFDAVWNATYAALKNVLLPRSWWDPDVIPAEGGAVSGGGGGAGGGAAGGGGGATMGGVLCSPLASEAWRLQLRGRPVACTWGVFEPAEGKVLQVTTSNTVGNDTDHETSQLQNKPPSQDQTQAQTQTNTGRSWILADPTDAESSLCRETVTLVVDCTTSSTTSATPTTTTTTPKAKTSDPQENNNNNNNNNNNTNNTRILALSKSGGTVLGRQEMRHLVKEARERWGVWNSEFG